jgi:hypothetical protein
VTKSIEEIRDAIQAANDLNGGGAYEGLVPFLAETVATAHEPPFPNDRDYPGAQLAKSLPIEHEMHDLAIENRRMDLDITIRGADEIVMKGAMTGILRHDGSELVHPVHIVLTVADGQIVKFWVDASSPEIMEGYRRQGEALQSPEVRPLYEKLIAAMGLEVPAAD